MAADAEPTPSASGSDGPRVLLAGGGTAGHTSPLLATAHALTERRPDVQITCLGTPRGLEVELVPAAGYPLELVPPVPMPRRPGKDLALLPGRLAGTVRATARVMERVRPDVVVGFGGYVSVPAYLAARRRRVPIVVHEGNAVPGMANRLGARFTERVATSFPDTDLPHARFLGLPIRRAISELDRATVRAQARADLGLDADRPTLLVTGGSQGARSLNHAVSDAWRPLAEAGVQVLHVAGRPEEATPVRVDGDPPYVVRSFVDRIELAYAAADLVLCRAGANTVTEVAAIGLPAVFVPLPHGNGEQAHNAGAVVEAGGALLIDDAALGAEWVGTVVPRLLTDTARLEQMSRAATGLVPRDADVALADLVLEAVAG